jgi:hypothetical protein
MSVRRIRLAAREGRYAYSVHALEEMDDDDLLDSDVLEVLMRGKVVATLTGDQRGPRFVVSGLAADNQTQVEVICRFLPTAILRIITVYAINE